MCNLRQPRTGWYRGVLGNDGEEILVTFLGPVGLKESNDAYILEMQEDVKIFKARFLGNRLSKGIP